ncbi:hypothetical protein PMIT1303_01559 [Prochlorococcus sp. MIT 1303]|nr:hypothetical protein PMIT1303_01559 [Prochlorococcus sp. MIT 1303]
MSADKNGNRTHYHDQRSCHLDASTFEAQRLDYGVGLMNEDKLIEYNVDEDYFRYSSGYYWEDCEASSAIFVTQKMVDKYKLEHDRTDEWSMDAHKYADWQAKNAEFFSEMESKYAQIIYLDHVIDYSKAKDGGRTTDTPHGDVKSLEFVAWFNSIPFELLKESKDDVSVERWCE